MRIIETHSGLSTKLIDKSDYDGLWVSSLTHSAVQGLPDNEMVHLKERIDFLFDIKKFTKKPIIVDIDNGGPMEHLPFMIEGFERAGAYAIIMEDKRGTKQNSLIENAIQELEDIDIFAKKIQIAKKSAGSMKVYARLESLIAKKSKYEALLRASAYIEAGADGIMVHSKQKVDCTEVMEVGNELRAKYPHLTLIAVPTTYILPKVHPFDIIITANHLLRASMKAMYKFLWGEKVELASVQDLFDLVGH